MIEREKGNGDSSQARGTTVPLNQEEGLFPQGFRCCPATAAAAATATMGLPGSWGKRQFFFLISKFPLLPISHFRPPIGSFPWSSCYLSLWTQCVGLGFRLPLSLDQEMLDGGEEKEKKIHREFVGTLHSSFLPRYAWYHSFFRALRWLLHASLSKVFNYIWRESRVERAYLILMKTGICLLAFALSLL